MCLAAQFDDSRIDEGAKISIKSSFMEIIFLSVHSTEVMCQAKILLFGVNCRLWLAGLGEKWERYEANHTALSLRLRYHPGYCLKLIILSPLRS